MSDERILNGFNHGLELLISDKVESILAEKGIKGSEFEALTVEEAAKKMKISKSIVIELIHQREDTGFPGAKVSKKVFVVNGIQLEKWLINGGLAGSSNKETTNTSLKAVK